MTSVSGEKSQKKKKTAGGPQPYFRHLVLSEDHWTRAKEVVNELDLLDLEQRFAYLFDDEKGFSIRPHEDGGFYVTLTHNLPGKTRRSQSCGFRCAGVLTGTVVAVWLDWTWRSTKDWPSYEQVGLPTVDDITS